MGGLDTTLTGLFATQVQQQQSQLNIANMQVDGYRRHDVLLGTQVDPQGHAVGVEVLNVFCPNDPFIFAAMYNQGSEVGFAEIISDYLKQLQPFFGLAGREDNLAIQVTEAFNQLEVAAQNPQDPSFAKTALVYLGRLTKNINELANEVQNQRLEADAEIGTSAQTVNALLARYQKLNQTIIMAKARGGNPLDFETQRDDLCLQIAKHIPVTQAPQANGSCWLYMKNGTLLVTDLTVQTLDFVPVSAMAPNYSYGVAGPLSGLSIGGRDVTNDASLGKIGGLFQLRDAIFPAIQNQLDAFAVGLRDQLNAHHNAGTAYAAPQTLAGNKTCLATDAMAATGTVRLGVVGPDKKFVAYRDINLNTVGTVGAFITAINGLPGGNIASLTPSNTLQLQASPGNSIALVSLDPNNPAVATISLGVTQGISDYFGLNSMMDSELQPVGANTPATTLGIANVIKVSALLLANPGLYANGTLNTSPAPIPPNPAPVPPVGPATWALTNGDNSNGLKIAAAYEESWTFPAAGGLVVQTVTLNNYAIGVISQNATTASEATKTSTAANDSFLNLKGMYKEITGVSESEDVTKLSFYAQQMGVLTSATESLKKLQDLISNLMRV